MKTLTIPDKNKFEFIKHKKSMKIYLIHGEYSFKSYEKLKEYIKKAKEDNWGVVYVSDESGFNIQETFSSKDFFISKKVFILENLSKLTSEDIAWLNKNKDVLDGILVFYSKNTVKDNFIKSFNKIDRIEEFKLPENIYTFLNSFYPKNAESCIKKFHSLLHKENIEFIFFLLSKHLRDLFWVKLSPSNIPYPSWRVEKLEKQAARFSTEKLKEIINDLSDIDIKSKTSKTNLTDLLDLLIIRKLE